MDDIDVFVGPRQKIKCVVVGDVGVGKTSLLFTYTARKFLGACEYKPWCLIDDYQHEQRVDDVPYCLGLWDTVGGEQGVNRLRPLTYPQTDVFLVCFAVDNQPSFDNVTTKCWKPELHHYVPNVPIILVGTKTDLRGNTNNDPEKLKAEFIFISRGEKMARDIGAVKYVECSALTLEGLDNVFEEAVRVATRHLPPKKKKRSCIVF